MLIGLTGRAGAGKDEAARAVLLAVDLHGGNATVTSFADPLYQSVAAITGISVGRLRDRAFKEEAIDWLGKSPRQLLQTLGTEWGRGMVHPDIWVRATMRLAQRDMDSGLWVVIPDVRFDNEARAIREVGGRVFRVIRPGAGCLSAEAAVHPSEAGIRDELVDAEIVNDGDLDRLRKRTLKAIMK